MPIFESVEVALLMMSVVFIVMLFLFFSVRLISLMVRRINKALNIDE